MPSRNSTTSYPHSPSLPAARLCSTSLAFTFARRATSISSISRRLLDAAIITAVQPRLSAISTDDPYSSSNRTMSIEFRSTARSSGDGRFVGPSGFATSERKYSVAATWPRSQLRISPMRRNASLNAPLSRAASGSFLRLWGWRLEMGEV